jgi:hypothetical protein
VTALYRLTAAQERALLAFADDWAGGHYTRPSGVRVATIDRLAALGLVTTHEYPSTTVARITVEGDRVAKLIASRHAGVAALPTPTP